MLTFDSDPTGTPGNELPRAGVLPEVIEIGENEAYWIQVQRSKKTLLLISKQTGAVVTSIKDIDSIGVELSTEELDLLGLSPMQNGIIKALAQQLRRERDA